MNSQLNVIKFILSESWYDMYSIERRDPLVAVLARYNSERCVLSAKEKLSHSSCHGVSLPHKFTVSRVQIHKLSLHCKNKRVSLTQLRLPELH